MRGILDDYNTQKGAKALSPETFQPMADALNLDIDWAKQYPHLPTAPIVEAVIHWQARAERPMDREALHAELVERLPEYPQIEAQQAILFAMEAAMGEITAPPTTSQQVGWHGFRVSSANGLNIAQYQRNGLIFSRLRPYQDWDVFEAEGRRLWRIFVEVGAPSQIQRLGVRFINRIGIRAIDELGRYLREPPTCPLSLPLKSFLYQSTFDVQNDLGINVVKTVQSLESEGQAANWLIVDTDVFTKRSISCDDSALNEWLPKMRWLKNAVFFSLLTEHAIASFQKG